MAKHHKPEHDRPPRARRSDSGHPTPREERDAGRKLMLFALAAIVIVLGGAYFLSRS